MSFIELAIPGVQGLTPYQPGKPITELERELGIRDIVKLASNENPLGPSPRALEIIQREAKELGRYPDGNGFALKKALADKFNVGLEQVTLGNGSNDILELLARAFVSPENEVVFSDHAFAVYPIVTQAVGAIARITPAKDWGYDLGAVSKAINDKTRLILIANPNNPTGTWLQSGELESFIASVPKHVLVVVDEAYYEIAAAPCLDIKGYATVLPLIDRYPNLVVTRTFSKAYGLAGLRMGYSISHSEVADVLNRVRQPFNTNSLALAAAEIALTDEKHLQKSCQLVCDGMQYMTNMFDEMGLDYIPSAGNFISVNVKQNGRDLFNKLLREGVIVRPVDNYGMPEFLRITIGTENENSRFIQVLKKVF
ncbi:MAG: histidinol-phosphate transaminase [Gammaproteobacteria bacterium]|nr:histidinol-phosphate transaminase [Gammaproteobacteria bacterium]